MSTIYYLLDESGSMLERKEKVISGMTEFLQDQRRLMNRCTVNIYTFNDSIRIVRENCDIKDIEEFPVESYNPHHCTALLDAMGFVLERIPSQKDDSTKYIVIILTDGEENSSHRFTPLQIEALLEQRRHVQIIYVGSNQDAILHGAYVGANQDSILPYDDEFLVDAMRCTSQAVRRYQTDSTPSVIYTGLERRHSLGKKTVTM